MMEKRVCGAFMFECQKQNGKKKPLNTEQTPTPTHFIPAQQTDGSMMWDCWELRALCSSDTFAHAQGNNTTFA